MEDPEIEGFMRGATSEEEDEATGVAGTATLSGGPIAIRLESYRADKKKGTYGDENGKGQQQLEKQELTRSRRGRFATSSCWAPSTANRA